MSYLLSIVVPTKDRYFYLKHLITLIKGFKTDDIELVVQDNTKDNVEILKFIDGLSYQHLKYFYTKEQISGSLNADKAILNSTGEYVCFIGDDDGVLSNIVNCVKWLKTNDIEALRSAIAIYNWPDYIDNSIYNISGAVLYESFSNKARKIDCIKSVKKLANHGFKELYHIPKVYQGIVKRSCLDKIYSIGETFFPGPSPDMANAIALSFIVNNFVIIQIPVIVVGQCVSVGGRDRLLKEGVLEIESLTHLPKEAKSDWSPRIPKVFCDQTVWPESAIKALKYMGKEDDIDINYEYIIAFFVHRNGSKFKYGWTYSHKPLIMLFYLASMKIWWIIFAISWRLFYLINKKIYFTRNIKRSIKNIINASDHFENNFKRYFKNDSFTIIDFPN